MANFQIFASKYEAIEGGYQKLRWDAGNYVCANDLKQAKGGNCSDSSTPVFCGTNNGISCATRTDTIGRIPSESEIQAVTLNDDLKIIKNRYWNYQRADDMSSQAIAEIIVDGQVNQGYIGVKAAQRALRQLGETVAVDGRVGSGSLAAIENQVRMGNEILLYNMIREERLKEYRNKGGNIQSAGENRMDRHFPALEGNSCFGDSDCAVDATEVTPTTAPKGDSTYVGRVASRSILNAKYWLQGATQLHKAPSARYEWGAVLVLLALLAMLGFYQQQLRKG